MKKSTEELILTQLITLTTKVEDVGVRVSKQESITKSILIELNTLNTKFDNLEDKMNKKFDAIDEKFIVIDERFDAIDARFDAIDERFVSIEYRLDKAEMSNEKLYEAFQTTSEFVMSHERRLGKLETVMA